MELTKAQMARIMEQMKTARQEAETAIAKAEEFVRLVSA